MATNVFHGRKGLVKIAASSSVAHNNLGRLRNFSLDVTAGTVDATNFDSSGYRELLDGIKSATFTAESVFLSTVATHQQDNLRTALSSGVRQHFHITNSTGAGAQTFKFYGYVTGWNLSADLNDVQLYGLSVDVDGKWTEGTTA